MIPYCFIEQALWFSGSAGFYRGAVNSTLLTQTAWEKKTWRWVAEKADAKFGRGGVAMCILMLDWQNDASPMNWGLLEWSVGEQFHFHFSKLHGF